MRISPLGRGGVGQRRNTQSSWPSQVTGPGMSSAFSGKNHSQSLITMGINAITAWSCVSQLPVMFQNKLLTCRLGSGEDELRCAATYDLSIARVNIDAVNRKRLQARDLQLTFCHWLLNEFKFLVCRILFGGAAVASGLKRRGSATVAVQVVAAGVSRVGDAKQISAATICWPEK